MGEHTSSALNGHLHICLLSAFIVKMRWDICIKDKDACELQKLEVASVRFDRLHKVILTIEYCKSRILSI